VLSISAVSSWNFSGGEIVRWLINKFLKVCICILGSLAGLSLTGCPVAYGPSPDTNIHGAVVRHRDREPIKGIRVFVEETDDNQLTCENGLYSIMVHRYTGDVTVIAEDIDGPENGGYFETATETIFISPDQRIRVDFRLEEKEEE
jgi:hypothetical protein